jgi:hypothetical protein
MKVMGIKNIFLILFFVFINNDYTLNQIQNYTMIIDRIINMGVNIDKGSSFKYCSEFCDSISNN